MTTGSTSTQLPPYVSYKTFGNFLVTLQPQVPSRIDRSVWGICSPETPVLN